MCEISIEYSTLQCLKIRCAFLVRPNTVAARTRPVAPVCNIFQTLVKLSIFQVLGTYKTLSSAGVNKILEGYESGWTVVATPISRHWPSRAWEIRVRRPVHISVFLKIDAINLCGVKDLGTTFFCMSEKDLITLRSDNIPGVSIRAASRNEIGIFSRY